MIQGSAFQCYIFKNYIYKVVISVCLEVWMSDHNLLTPLYHFPTILIRELGRITGMFLAWFKHLQVSGSSFMKKTLGRAEFQKLV